MNSRNVYFGAVAAGLVATSFGLGLLTGAGGGQPPEKKAPPDAAAEATRVQKADPTRPEQKKGAHDKSDVFDPANSPPSSPALKDQPEEGKFQGFVPSRDPLDAKKPLQTFQEIYQEETALKPKVMALQQKLLEARYDLKPKLDPEAKMSR